VYTLTSSHSQDEYLRSFLYNKVPALSTVPRAALDEISPYLVWIMVDKGHQIFQQGASSAYLAILKSVSQPRRTHSSKAAQGELCLMQQTDAPGESPDSEHLHGECDKCDADQ
jgi:hypothetical protein